MDGGCGTVCDYICGENSVQRIPRVRMIVSVEFRSHKVLYNRCLNT